VFPVYDAKLKTTEKLIELLEKRCSIEMKY